MPNDCPVTSVLLNEFTDGAMATEKGRLFHTFVILKQQEAKLSLKESRQYTASD